MRGKISKLTRFVKYLAPSAVTFLVGTGSLVLVDIILSRYAAKEDLNDWIILKSLMLPLATLALLGIDQIVVREPSKTKLFIRPTLLLAFAIAALASFITWITGFYEQPIILFFVVIGIAVSSLYFGIFRATLHFNLAQAARDGWKFLFLLALGPLYFYYKISPNIILLGALTFIVIVMTWRYSLQNIPQMNEVHDEVHDFRTALSVAWPFCAAAFALSIASYGELLLVKSLGGDDILPAYFRATILFSMPFVMFNTYIATFLGSAIRQSPKRYCQMLLRYRWYILACMPLLPVLALLLGYAISPWLFPNDSTPMLWAVFLAATAGMRLGYSLLSSYIGALGTRREITAISVYYLVCAILTVPLCWAIYFLTSDLAVSAALTGTLHWFARAFVGWRLTSNLVHVQIL